MNHSYEKATCLMTRNERVLLSATSRFPLPMKLDAIPKEGSGAHTCTRLHRLEVEVRLELVEDVLLCHKRSEASHSEEEAVDHRV